MQQYKSYSLKDFLLQSPKQPKSQSIVTTQEKQKPMISIIDQGIQRMNYMSNQNSTEKIKINMKNPHSLFKSSAQSNRVSMNYQDKNEALQQFKDYKTLLSENMSSIDPSPIQKQIITKQNSQSSNDIFLDPTNSGSLRISVIQQQPEQINPITNQNFKSSTLTLRFLQSIMHEKGKTPNNEQLSNKTTTIHRRLINTNHNSSQFRITKVQQQYSHRQSFSQQKPQSHQRSSSSIGNIKEISNYQSKTLTIKEQIAKILELQNFLSTQLVLLANGNQKNQKSQKSYDQQDNVSDTSINLQVRNQILQFKDNFSKFEKMTKNCLNEYSDNALIQDLKIKQLETQVHQLIYGNKDQDKPQKQNQEDQSQLTNIQSQKETLEQYEDLKILQFNYNQMKKEFNKFKQLTQQNERFIQNEKTLLEIKLQHSTQEYEDLQQKLREIQDKLEQKELVKAMQVVAQWSDDELRKRERLILQIQQDKGDLRDVIWEKEKKIKSLEDSILEKDLKIRLLEVRLDDETTNKIQIEKNMKEVADKLKAVKEKYKKKSDELNQARNLTSKYKDLIAKLEKELKKGYNDGVIVQYEDMPIEELLRTSNLFRAPQNIYAINNTTKISLNYKNNLLSSNNTGIEKKILGQWEEEYKKDGSNEGATLKPAASTYDYVNLEQVSLYMHNLARPSFFCFIEHELQRIKLEQEKEKYLITNESGSTPLLNTKMSNVFDRSMASSIPSERIRFEPPHKMWLFVTMRAILDSKYTEHKLYIANDPRSAYNIQRFPEFVYQWMGNFQFDEKTLSVIPIHAFEKDKVDNLRLQLLVGLQTMKPTKMWECNLFVEFLEVKFTSKLIFNLQERFLNDDLHFFLHARNLIHNGPQLQDLEATQEPLYLVEEKQVHKVVEILFHHMVPNDISDIKQKFTNIAKQKFKGIQLPTNSETSGSIPMDSSMVLRVLLEYYRNEKKAKSVIIKRLFKEQNGSQQNSNINYQGFKDVMEQIQPDITSSDKAKLFRDSWMMGNGRVNYDSFMVAANETNFFVKSMLLRGNSVQPQLDHNNEILTEVYGMTSEQQETSKSYLYLYTLWAKIEKYLMNFKPLIESLGLEDHLKDYNFIENFIRQKGQYDSQFVNGRDFIQIFRQFMLKIQQIRAIFLEIYEKEPMLFKSAKEIQNEINQEQILQFIEIIDKELKILEEIKSEEVQKIRSKQRSSQNWSKIKDQLQKNYTQFFKINKNMKTNTKQYD